VFCEVKWIEGTQRWHPHLHVITEGSYIPQDELAKQWKTITRTSHVVDIGALRDDGHTLRYVTKYASKPMNGSFSNSVALLTEAVGALKGRKLIGCFGTWSKYKLLAKSEPEGWTPIGKYSTLVARAQAGDEEAIEILRVLDEQKSVLDSKFESSLRSHVADAYPNPP